MTSESQWRRWTNHELKRASELWANGLSTLEIANELERPMQSMKHAIYRNRDLFPFRHQKHGPNSRAVDVRIMTSEYLYRTMKRRALEENISLSLLVSRVLREKFIKEDQSLAKKAKS